MNEKDFSEDKKYRQNGRTVRLAVIGCIVVAAILILTDLWLGQSVKDSVKNEFPSVSESYIGKLSDTMRTISVIQIILILVMMLVVLGAMLVQMRKTLQSVLEKKTAELENRIKQEEQEERQKLKNRLQAEEKNSYHRDAMIRALSSEYRSVYYFNLDIDEAICYRVSPDMSDWKSEGDSVIFSQLIHDYVMENVVEADREGVLQFISPEYIKESLKHESIISHRYLIEKNGKNYYEMIRIARINEQKDIHAVSVGFANVDEETRESLARNEVLADALAQAQNANEAKTTFLSNMSHGIRTPLNAVIGFSNMAMRNIDNQAQVRDSLEKVISSGEHLLRLINDILDMSSIESGRVFISEKEYNLSKLIHNVVTIIYPQAAAKEQNFSIDAFEVQNEEVYVDSLKVNQVLINLLNNAVKYTPEKGNVAMRISEHVSEREGYAEYKFSIKDTGIGMSKEFTNHIFDAYEREKTATQTGMQGTGLGMAITKNIVDLMEGNIEVRSEVGKGSEFVVTLEFKLAENVREPFSIEGVAGFRALVVDDDVNTCDSVTKLLQQIGVSSEWASSSHDAMSKAEKAFNEDNPFHIYIINLRMPEKNGVKLARQIRRISGDSVPMIILTAYDWSEVEEEARTAGVTAFCTKPLFMSDIKAALSTSMGNEQNSEEQDELAGADFSGKRVLLVEDIELNRQIARYILNEVGMTVEEAVDGSEAVRMVGESDENYYDLILTDIRMPIMDGYESTRTIRSLDRKDIKHMPIIAMTANAFDEDRELALKSGMNDHITKPLEIGRLLEVLTKYLKR